ncbi:hypothetical protein [Sulfurimonas crateris]|nr:hypothetical protein [Sulfurimonas crateris]
MKKVISMIFVMMSMTIALSAAQSSSDDKSVIRGEQPHPDKGILY